MSELSEAINEMRNMRESYNQIGAAAEAYNTGKAQLAENINSKGVQASATETLPELAEKVAAISQETYEINGGEMYAKQLFGSLETPNYWNLYEVLAQLLSDGRLVSYGGILLAEYYRGYDSLALAGAGAGGAYVVSDKDGDGNFIMYTNDTTHTWATEFDGKGNRWVAYCFADEYHDFQITDTNTSPRSIFIGRKVGTITSLVAGRVSQIVVPDGNELTSFVSAYAQNFSPVTTIKNISIVNDYMLKGGSVVSSLYLQAGSIDTTNVSPASDAFLRQTFNNVIIEANQILMKKGHIVYIDGGTLQSLIIKSEDIDFYGSYAGLSCVEVHNLCPLKEVIILGVERIRRDGYQRGAIIAGYNSWSQLANLTRYYIGYKSNDKTRTIELIVAPTTTDVELQDGWNKPILVAGTTDLTEENMYAHILQKLKQDEPMCGSSVTITLGSTNLAKLTSEESQALLAELRGTYGYTFA